MDLRGIEMTHKRPVEREYPADMGQEVTQEEVMGWNAWLLERLEDLRIGHHFDNQPTFKMINEFNERINQLIREIEEG